MFFCLGLKKCQAGFARHASTQHSPFLWFLARLAFVMSKVSKLIESSQLHFASAILPWNKEGSWSDRILAQTLKWKEKTRDIRSRRRKHLRWFLIPSCQKQVISAGNQCPRKMSERKFGNEWWFWSSRHDRKQTATVLPFGDLSVYSSRELKAHFR